MTDFFRFTLNGLTLGCVLALLALGWVIVFKVSGVLNLAQGAFFVIGALTFTGLAKNREWPLAAAMVVAVLASTGTAVAMDTIALRPARRGHHAGPVIITLGMAEILAELSRKVWGNDALLMKPYLQGKPFVVFDVFITRQSVLLWFATLVLLLGAWLLFEKTLVGKALQACAENREGAELVGINPANVRTLAFALAGAVGAIGGILLAPVTPIGWDGGIIFGLKGFVAAVVGGWTYPGAVLGGILIGLTENYSAGYIDSAWKNVVSLSSLIIVMLLRPQGLASLGGGLVGRLRRRSMVTSPAESAVAGSTFTASTGGNT